MSNVEAKHNDGILPSFDKTHGQSNEQYQISRI